MNIHYNSTHIHPIAMELQTFEQERKMFIRSEAVKMSRMKEQKLQGGNNL